MATANVKLSVPSKGIVIDFASKTVVGSVTNLPAPGYTIGSAVEPVAADWIYDNAHAEPASGVTIYVQDGATSGTGTPTQAPANPAGITATADGAQGTISVVVTPSTDQTRPAPVFYLLSIGSSYPSVRDDDGAYTWTVAPGTYTPTVIAVGNGGMSSLVSGTPVSLNSGTGIPPVVTSNPTISGSSTYGSTLTVALPPATGAVSSSIQWLRDGVVIPGATSNSYALVVADVGKVPGVRVVWTSADGAITTRTAVYSTVGKATQTASRMPSLVLQSNIVSPGNGVVGETHLMNAGAFSITPSDATESHDLLIDGVPIALGTHGYTVGTWVPQESDIGKTFVYRQSFTGSAYVNDAAWPSIGYTVVSAASSQASATVTNATPTTGATPGVMVLLSAISGATADAGTSITITSRTDAASTGGVGVWELSASELTAYQAGSYSLPVGGMVFDIPPTLAQGTTITTGPFSSGTVALVFAPIGSGTYSYTLGLGSAVSQTAADTGVFFDSGQGQFFDSGDGLYFES